MIFELFAIAICTIVGAEDDNYILQDNNIQYDGTNLPGYFKIYRFPNLIQRAERTYNPTSSRLKEQQSPLNQESLPVIYSVPVKKLTNKIQTDSDEESPEAPSSPSQYDYGYTVSDPLSGDSKTQYESRQGDLVKGMYSLIDPDGSRRIVEYTADPKNGFNAIVRKETPKVQAKDEPRESHVNSYFTVPGNDKRLTPPPLNKKAVNIKRKPFIGALNPQPNSKDIKTNDDLYITSLSTKFDSVPNYSIPSRDTYLPQLDKTVFHAHPREMDFYIPPPLKKAPKVLYYTIFPIAPHSKSDPLQYY